MITHVAADGLGLSVASIFGCLVVAAQFRYIVYYQENLENKALSGDADAARNIILPCYTILFQFMVYLYIVFAIAISWTLMHSSATGYARYATIQYFSFVQLVVFTAVPTLFIQKHVSIGAFKRTAKLIFPWWAASTGIWVSNNIQRSIYFSLKSSHFIS